MAIALPPTLYKPYASTTFQQEEYARARLNHADSTDVESEEAKFFRALMQMGSSDEDDGSSCSDDDAAERIVMEPPPKSKKPLPLKNHYRYYRKRKVLKPI